MTNKHGKGKYWFKSGSPTPDPRWPACQQLMIGPIPGDVEYSTLRYTHTSSLVGMGALCRSTGQISTDCTSTGIFETCFTLFKIIFFLCTLLRKVILSHYCEVSNESYFRSSLLFLKFPVDT
jgi:hypothetical protein